MFNKNFYPTPPNLVRELIAPYEDRLTSWYTTILEPSAWKGDIARVLSNYRRCKVHLIEIEPELAQIAKQYGQLVDNDFLSFEPDTDYDFIIANPPFDNGDDHFLKAWEIAKNTTIVFILNAETLKNPYSAKRKLIRKIIEDNNWTIEYKENAFKEAERTTGVEIAIVRVTKVTENSFKFQEFDTECEYFAEEKEMWIQTPDKIENLIQDYQRTKTMFAEWMAKIHHAQNVSRTFARVNLLDIANKATTTNGAIQELGDILRIQAWNHIINELGIQKYMTGKVLEAFQAKMKEQGKIAINKKNIALFIETVLQNGNSILEENITVVFDMLTLYDKDNRFHPEWWAHNEGYMVGKKFVLPNIVDLSSYIWVTYWAEKPLWDLDKCMAYLSGTNEYKTSREAIREAIKNAEMEAETEFFKIKFYKKGTAHFTFKSQKLWADFNIRATKSLGWLPADMEGKWRQKNKF